HASLRRPRHDRRARDQLFPRQSDRRGPEGRQDRPRRRGRPGGRDPPRAAAPRAPAIGHRQGEAQAMSTADRLAELFATRDSSLALAAAALARIADVSGEHPVVRGASRLEAQGLVKTYKGRRVVNDVSVDLAQGEIVGLLGPNGAGKTTTFYMITGLIRPEQGRILLDGRDIT